MLRNLHLGDEFDFLQFFAVPLYGFSFFFSLEFSVFLFRIFCRLLFLQPNKYSNVAGQGNEILKEIFDFERAVPVSAGVKVTMYPQCCKGNQCPASDPLGLYSLECYCKLHSCVDRGGR